MRRLLGMRGLQPGLLGSCLRLASVMGGLCLLSAVWVGLLPWPAHAVEQAEVEYAKGIVEYGTGNYRDALQHFRTAVGLAPDDANAHFYLALAHSRVGEFQAAIAPLEKALQLDPTMQYAHYHLGLAYFQEQRYAEALGPLQSAATFDADNAAVKFYQGYALYQLKRYRDALPPLEQTITLDPNLASTAQYYRGATLYALESDSQARTAFETARAPDPSSPLGQNAQRYLEALQARERERRWWEVEGSMSLQYDDNVILEPNSISISRQDDGRLMFNATGRVFPLRTSLWQVGAEYDFFQSLHFRLHEFDIRTHTFGLFGQAKFHPVTLRLGVHYMDTALDNAPFSETLSVSPSATITQTETLLALVSMQYRRENYQNDVPTGFDPVIRGRDGWNLRTGFDQFWLFNNKRAYARLSYHYDAQRGDGSDWEYNGHEVGLGVQTPLVAGITLDAHGSYYRFGYQHVNSFDVPLRGVLTVNDTRARTDHRFTVGLGLARDIGRYMTVSAGYVHTSNQSNISFFDYRRNLLTLAISGRY